MTTHVDDCPACGVRLPVGGARLHAPGCPADPAYLPPSPLRLDRGDGIGEDGTCAECGKGYPHKPDCRWAPPDRDAAGRFAEGGHLGRPKGAKDRFDARTKGLIDELVEHGLDGAKRLYDRLVADDPEAALKVLTRLMEYRVPRLARVESVGDGGGPVVVERRVVVEGHDGAPAPSTKGGADPVDASPKGCDTASHAPGATPPPALKCRHDAAFDRDEE